MPSRSSPLSFWKPEGFLTFAEPLECFPGHKSLSVKNPSLLVMHKKIESFLCDLDVHLQEYHWIVAHVFRLIFTKFAIQASWYITKTWGKEYVNAEPFIGIKYKEISPCPFIIGKEILSVDELSAKSLNQVLVNLFFYLMSSRIDCESPFGAMFAKTEICLWPDMQIFPKCNQTSESSFYSSCSGQIVTIINFSRCWVMTVLFEELKEPFFNTIAIPDFFFHYVAKDTVDKVCI